MVLEGGEAGWIDSHSHVQTMEDPDELLARARAAGVVGVVCVGTDLATSEAAHALAARHRDVGASVGLHPHEASRLAAERRGLEALVRGPGVVAVGETGFDFHYLHSRADEQEDAFRWQIALTHELDRALVIHSRDAWNDTFRVLADEGPPARTVFHCFTGGPDQARRALDLGACLSFSGIATFPGATELRDAIAITPLDRVLVETDSPYLAPVPERGKVNEPAFVAHVGRAVASALGRTEEEVAERVHTNTRALFGPLTGN